MHLRAHRVTQGAIDYLMALDERPPFELRTDDQSLEMVAAAGEILYLNLGAGKRLFDFELNFCGIHCRVS